ncbi:hypothetical protein [Saccharopolyspora cebuensis]|uniref:Uncharacterized protein n=1 Tax=Saccharopolyspora cebuensis TaxID=418759 RepID=A0ABV4CFE4_9PSEU
MRAQQRGELVRLCRAALDRPRWQQVLAFVVSLWALAWIVAQFVVPERDTTALAVLGEFADRTGLAGEWVQRLAASWYDTGAGLAAFGGLLWAATTERGQGPALLGWLAVMLSAERLGYQPAILVALATLVGFVALLWVASLTSAGMPDRRSGLRPRDVLRAGVTAAALTAVVPLFAPLLVLCRLVRPYLTKAPRLLPPGDAAPARGGWTRVRADDEEPGPR